MFFYFFIARFALLDHTIQMMSGVTMKKPLIKPGFLGDRHTWVVPVFQVESPDNFALVEVVLDEVSAARHLSVAELFSAASGGEKDPVVRIEVPVHARDLVIFFGGDIWEFDAVDGMAAVGLPR